MRKTFIAILICGIAIAGHQEYRYRQSVRYMLAQQPPAPETAPSEQEPESEEGKPASCDNYHNTAPAHRCGCGKAMHDKCDQPEPSVRNDSKCKTNCIPSHCHCIGMCAT